MKHVVLFLSLFFQVFVSQTVLSADGPSVSEKSDFTTVTIRNETQSTIFATSVDPIHDLGIIPADWRFVTKAYQWGKSFCCSEVETLESGSEKILSIPQGKKIAFYRKDLARVSKNVAQGSILLSAVSSACAGIFDCSGSVIVGSLYTGKCALNKMERPGERITETILSGSKITLSDLPADGQLCEDEDLKKQIEEGRSILIKITPPE